jgi:hypothetical protein
MNDAELLKAFESQSISNDDWSHEYHIRVASIYLSNLDFDTALDKVKSGIKQLNAVNKVPESQFRGFHETLTLGWLKLVVAKLNEHEVATSLELITQCPDLLNSRLLSEYYSPDRLMSLEAKKRFIEPDLKPLT